MSGSAPTRGRLLIVDDEEPQRQMLASILGRAGFEVDGAENGAGALERMRKSTFDLVLTDQRMPKMDGLELLEQINRMPQHPPVVLMTAHGSVSTAVEAMKRGAADYLIKPFESDELLLVLEKVLRHRRLEDEVASLHHVLRERCSLSNIIGGSPAMQQVFSLIERVASTDASVLISGESGTGKELVARAIHQLGRRASRPFVALNCAAIPENLLESEFFGHERGAFTGAVRAHAGRFEQADRGTLFLDEVGAMRFDLQAKLLRAIQEGEIQRIGSTRSLKVDVRIVSATCADLEEEIRQKTFRDDLYYRLNVIPVHLPPLRERLEDIPSLIEQFLKRASDKFSRPLVRIGSNVLERMQHYGWPGNVRELENCIERMVVLSSGEALGLDDLPSAVSSPGKATGSGSNAFALPAEGVRLEELERDLILQALERTRGSIRPASRLLGISYKTLQYRIRKHGLETTRSDSAASAGESID